VTEKAVADAAPAAVNRQAASAARWKTFIVGSWL
jgi:hypothetical protein